MAAIARAFSTRPKPSVSTERPTIIKKSSSLRLTNMQISAPILVSTTNFHGVHFNNDVRPPLRKVSSVSSDSSQDSGNQSDASSVPGRPRGDSFTDSSSVGSTPSSPSPRDSPDWSIKSPARKVKSSTDIREIAKTQTQAIEAPPAVPPVPSIPSIPSPSRTQVSKASLRLLQNKLSSWQPTNRLGLGGVIPKSVPQEIQAPKTPKPHGSPFHPFKTEMRELDQVAEEWRDAAMQEDIQVMNQKGLRRFCADDYIRDLQPVFFNYFMPQPVTVAWI